MPVTWVFRERRCHLPIRTGLGDISVARGHTQPVGTFLSAAFMGYLGLSFYEGYLNQLYGSFTRYYIVLMLALFLARYRWLQFRVFHIFVLTWFAIKVLSSMFVLPAHGDDIVSRHLFSLIAMVALLVGMTVVTFEDHFVRLAVNGCLAYSVSISVLSLLYSKPYHGEASARQVLTLGGVQLDPNNQAALCAVGFGISLYYLVFGTHRSFTYLFLATLSGVAVVLTGSRGGLVTLIVILIILALHAAALRRWALVKRLTFLIVSGWLVFEVSSSHLPADVILRVFSVEDYGGGSGRIALWESGLRLLGQQPVFGLGWGGYPSGIHNTYLSMLLDVGLFGTAFFACAIGYAFRRAWRQRLALASVILASGLVPAFFIDAINKRFFWNAIILGFMIVQAQEACGAPTLQDSRTKTRR